MELAFKCSMLLVVMAAAVTGCRNGGAPSDDDLRARARRLAAEMVVVDTHVDVPYRLTEKMEDIGERTESGDFDYPRAREGGLNVPFMSIYVPASYQEDGGAAEFADGLIDMLQRIVADNPTRFSLVHSVRQARASAADERIGFAMGMENGAPIEGHLDKLRHFHQRGIRYITLTHSKNNHICDSSYDEERRWNGLSPFGKRLVEEMNRVGMMIDVSHVSDEAFYQVLEISRAPVIASHSSCRRFTPDWERNMSDEMIRRLAQEGGVIQINFGSSFLLEAARAQAAALRDALREFVDRNQYEHSGAEAQEYRERYWKENARIYADVSDVAAHIDHVVQLVGVDHVGLGSDFDGVGDSLPTGLKDVSQYPNLIHELLRRGYSAADVQKICSGNILRVWSAVERYAAELLRRPGESS